MLVESYSCLLADDETALAWGRILPYSCGPSGWRISPLREHRGLRTSGTCSTCPWQQHGQAGHQTAGTGWPVPRYSCGWSSGSGHL